VVVFAAVWGAAGVVFFRNLGRRRLFFLPKPARKPYSTFPPPFHDWLSFPPSRAEPGWLRVISDHSRGQLVFFEFFIRQSLLITGAVTLRPDLHQVPDTSLRGQYKKTRGYKVALGG
jgi:hypothetical protein